MNTVAKPALAPTQSRAAQRHCPRCGSARVHRSRRHGVLDRVLRCLGARVRRCHDCRSRQAWFRWVAIPLDDGHTQSSLLTHVALVGSGFLICMLFLWWVLQRFSAMSG
jgi:hypothetical protein